MSLDSTCPELSRRPAQRPTKPVAVFVLVSLFVRANSRAVDFRDWDKSQAEYVSHPLPQTDNFALGWWSTNDGRSQDERINITKSRSLALVQPTLTERGQLIKRVLIVGLVGNVCHGDDWRGGLPMHLSRFLPQARSVLLESHPVTATWTCRACTPDGSVEIENRTDCNFYLGRADIPRNHADLVLIVGSGRQAPVSAPLTEHWPDLRQVLGSGYVDGNTLSIHVPIRKAFEIGRLFNFHHVIHDQDFAKPLSSSTIDEVERMCLQEKKTKELLYVGRYIPGKGQVDFLETVDPLMLKGYRIHFYSGESQPDSGYIQQMLQVGQQRKIDMSIHSKVDRLVLLKHSCIASGQIHYAIGDDNPRTCYEALYAGNPLFTTKESMLHKSMYSVPFVTWVTSTGSHTNQKQENFDAAFRNFMSMVHDINEWEPRIMNYARSYLAPAPAYNRLCTQVGICRNGTSPQLHQRH